MIDEYKHSRTLLRTLYVFSLRSESEKVKTNFLNKRRVKYIIFSIYTYKMQ